MTSHDPEPLGELDDATEEAEQPSTSEGASTRGDYDPSEGSPDSGAHPTGEDFPAEAARYDEPKHRRATGDAGEDSPA
jgi:hypothetical protein